MELAMKKYLPLLASLLVASVPLHAEDKSAAEPDGILLARDRDQDIPTLYDINRERVAKKRQRAAERYYYQNYYNSYYDYPNPCEAYNPPPYCED